jgi:hypothetical protein
VSTTNTGVQFRTSLRASCSLTSPRACRAGLRAEPKSRYFDFNPMQTPQFLNYFVAVSKLYSVGYFEAQLTPICLKFLSACLFSRVICDELLIHATVELSTTAPPSGSFYYSNSLLHYTELLNVLRNICKLSTRFAVILYAIA